MTKIMGVLNMTPDSFLDGGKYQGLDAAYRRVEMMVEQGVDIVDVGGESTKPYSDPVSADEELARISELISGFKARFDVSLSLDTRKAKVAAFGLAHGVDMINDVSGLSDDPDMARVVGEAGGQLVIMHKQGSAKTMQQNPSYRQDDVVSEVMAFFESAIATATAHGITDLVLDPGIGFGKTVTHCLTLLHQLSQFKRLGYPLLVSTGNKSFMGSITGHEADQRLPGTLASSLIAVRHGADIIRTHYVDEMRQALDIAQSIWDEKPVRELDRTWYS